LFAELMWVTNVDRGDALRPEEGLPAKLGRPFLVSVPATLALFPMMTLLREPDLSESRLLVGTSENGGQDHIPEMACPSFPALGGGTGPLILIRVSRGSATTRWKMCVNERATAIESLSDTTIEKLSDVIADYELHLMKLEKQNNARLLAMPTPKKYMKWCLALVRGCEEHHPF
jgi:hypothetical protein